MVQVIFRTVEKDRRCAQEPAAKLGETGAEQTGRPIGGNDLLIAAQAVALRHTLVTDKEREFARINGLACENWLRNA